MPRKKKEKPVLIIDKQFDQIVNGYIMGDGYLSSYGNLTVDHSTDQENFVLWMLEKLKAFCTPNRQPTLTPRHYKDRPTTWSLRFNTRNLFKAYHPIWYPEGEKRLPANIKSMFTPIFITIWYACNGTKQIGSLGAKFEVTSFTPEERLILKNLFITEYGITPEINRQGLSKTGTPQWALCINAPDYPKFHDLITRELDVIQTLFPNKLHSLK